MSQDVTATALPEEPSAPAKAAERAPVWPRTRWADVAVVAAGLLLAAATWGPVFGGVAGYLAAGGGVLIGGGLALAAARLRWEVITTSLAVAVGYLLAGGAVALPQTTIAGVVPRLQTLQLLVMQAVFGWKDLLTLRPPAASFTGPTVTPYLAGVLLAAVAVSVAARTRRPAFALLPVWLLAGLGIAWGVSDAPGTRWLGLALGVLTLGWASWLTWRRRGRQAGDVVDAQFVAGSAAMRTRRLAEATGLLAVAGLVGTLATPAVLATQPRDVLRDQITPPLNLHQYASPLTMYRYLEKDLKDDVLLTVDGLPEGGRVRLAAVDTYDGIVYNVNPGGTGSGGFDHVGTDVTAQPAGQATTLDVTIGEYAGVWLPGGGDLQRVEFTGKGADTRADGLFFNPDTGTALTTARVEKGATYQVDVVLPQAHTSKTLGNAPFGQPVLPAEGPVPEEAVALATEYVGDEFVPAKQAETLANQLRENGFFSDGSKDGARPGHTVERVSTLVGEPQMMVGDDEQYAVTMALMARKLGMPARVVMGFYPEKYDSGPIELTGKDAHVWVEVNFQDRGWVAFDPTPDRDKEPNQTVPKPKPQPKPQVLQPPEPPRDPPAKPLDLLEQDSDSDESPLPPIVLTLLLITGATLATLTVTVGPLLLIAGLKKRRRSARRHARRNADRMSGGWDEILDRATDFGTPLPATVTRQEAARMLTGVYPQAQGAVAVATRADAGVFGHGDPDAAAVRQLWTEVDGVLAALDSSVGRVQRLRARFSLRSLRGGRPTPGGGGAADQVEGDVIPTQTQRRRRLPLPRKRKDRT